MLAVSGKDRIEFTPDMVRMMHEEILEIIKAEFTIHPALCWDEESESWVIEFYASVLDNDIEVVGNAYIPKHRVKQIVQLMKIADAKKEELPEALASDDELIREAAEFRLQQLAKKKEETENRFTPRPPSF